MAKTRKKVIIVGGGLAGLSAADSLLPEYDVIIIEKADFLGGLASSFRADGEWIPKYYHHVVESNKVTQRFLKRYGLLKGNKWQRIKVTIGVKRKLTEITNPFQLLGFNFLSLWGKIRFGLFGIYALFLMDPDKIPDSKDAYSWLTKYAGKEVRNKIFHNLYARNKFNLSLKKISAKQFANRLKEREVYDKFTFPPKGLQGLIDGLERDILKKGGKILKKAAITSIDLKKRQVRLGKRAISADIIINTIPLPEFIAMSKGLPDSYTRQVSKVRYCPCVGLVFATKKFLNPKYYWINLFRERVQVIMQHSVLIDKYKNKITWCIRYGGSGQDLNLSDEEIKAAYLKDIKKYFPHARFEWVKVFREKYAEPIYDIDYYKYRPGYRTPLAGIYMAGIQVTFPKIRNMNVALESGLRVAELVKKDQSV